MMAKKSTWRQRADSFIWFAIEEFNFNNYERGIVRKRYQELLRKAKPRPRGGRK